MVRELDQIKRLWVRVLGRQELLVGGVNNQRSLYPQYHEWGALEQGTEPPTPGAAS